VRSRRRGNGCLGQRNRNCLETRVGSRLAPIVNTVILGAYAKATPANFHGNRNLLQAIEEVYGQTGRKCRCSGPGLRTGCDHGATLMEKKKIESVRQLPVMPLTIERLTGTNRNVASADPPNHRTKHPPARLRAHWPAHCRFHPGRLARDWNRALELLLEVNPLPGVTGRFVLSPLPGRVPEKKNWTGRFPFKSWKGPWPISGRPGKCKAAPAEGKWRLRRRPAV